MPRKMWMAAMAALALVACNQAGPNGSGANGAAGAPNAGGAAPSLASVFPDLTQASYRAEATVTNSGRASQIVMIRSGRRMRMELPGGNAVVSNLETQEAFMLINQSGRMMAMRTDIGAQQVRSAVDIWANGANRATRVGPCAGAGLTGTEFRLAPENQGDPERTTCVTNDGIILSATENGVQTWETTAVTRGPQDPALFVIPPGTQVMNMPGAGAGVAAAMEEMRRRQSQ